VRTGAAVDAQAERGVPVRPPVDVHGVGIVEDGRIPVGGGPAQQDAIPFLHRAGVELDVGGDGPGQGLRGREAAQELLHRTRQHVRVIDKLTPLIVMLIEPDQRLADQ